MAKRNTEVQVDWTGCDLVETNPRKVSGVPIVKGTRVQANAIVENFAGGSPIDEIAENFAIAPATIEQLLQFASRKPEPLHQ